MDNKSVGDACLPAKLGCANDFFYTHNDFHNYYKLSRVVCYVCLGVCVYMVTLGCKRNLRNRTHAQADRSWVSVCVRVCFFFLGKQFACAFAIRPP